MGLSSSPKMFVWGWGRVILIRHAYRDPRNGQVKFIDSQYGHLRSILVSKGDRVKRGQKIGTLGNNRGMYAAHLHFEIRHNLQIGMFRESVAKTMENWGGPYCFYQGLPTIKKRMATGQYAYWHL